MSHAEKLKPLVEGARALFEVAEALDRIGGIKAGEAAAVARIAELQAVTDEVMAKLDPARNELATAQAEARRLRTEIAAEAIEAASEASRRAQDIVAQAEADARATVERAKVQAGSVVLNAKNEAKATRDAAERTKADLDVEIRVKSLDAERLGKEIEQKQAQVSQLDARLAAVFERVSELRGAG